MHVTPPEIWYCNDVVVMFLKSHYILTDRQIYASAKKSYK